jgi:hypothetical protein
LVLRQKQLKQAARSSLMTNSIKPNNKSNPQSILKKRESLKEKAPKPDVVFQDRGEKAERFRRVKLALISLVRKLRHNGLTFADVKP